MMTQLRRTFVITAVQRGFQEAAKKYCIYFHHHHHRVARPWQDIAVSTSLRHLERSCARLHAELRPRLCCWRSSSIVRSQVRLGRPGGRRQSTGRRLMAARRAREWSWDGPARAMCPNRRSRLVVIRWVAGGWRVLRLTSSFVTCAIIWNTQDMTKAPLVGEDDVSICMYLCIYFATN